MSRAAESLQAHAEVMKLARLAALPARRRREVAQRARDATALERLPMLDQALSG